MWYNGNLLFERLVNVKKLRVTMFDGQQWDIPTGYIAMLRASNRASFLYDIDKQRIEWKIEFQNQLNVADDTLIEWINENISWKDVAAKAVAPEPQKFSIYHDWFKQTPKVIVNE